MSFADLEARCNASVMARMANARAAKVGGSGDFTVIFERAYVDTSVNASATRPVITAADGDIAGFASDVTQLTINAKKYTVRDIQPDGAGLSTLVLEAAL